MTTLVGIKSNYGPDSIVLVADRQVVEVDDRTELAEKRRKTKIQYGDNWAIGFCSGDYGTELPRLFGILKGYKNYGSSPERAREIIGKAIKGDERGHRRFMEILEMNAESRRKGVSLEDLCEFLFAINSPSLELWKIDEYGNLKEPDKDKDFGYICLGSGKDKAESYIKRQITSEAVEEDKIDTSTSIGLGLGALDESERDSDTGLGVDMLILTHEGIDNLGREIEEAVRKARRDKINEIMGRYHIELLE